MSGTPAWIKDEVVAYYQATTEESYLMWGGAALALHLGLDDGGGGLVDRAALDRSLLAMNALLADRAAIGAGARVLDAGCGVGGSAIWLARERAAEVVGVSLDPGQVVLARRFAEEQGARVTFAVHDFAATPFDEGSFDVVWNLESLCHVGDPRPYLTHVRSLLADGGRFVCADFFRGTGGPACDEMAAGWVLPGLRRGDEVTSALRDLGFTDVTWTDLRSRVLPSARWMATTAIFETLRLETAVAAGAPRRSTYERHFHAAVAASKGLTNGEIAYGIITATRPRRSRPA